MLKLLQNLNLDNGISELKNFDFRALSSLSGKYKIPIVELNKDHHGHALSFAVYAYLIKCQDPIIKLHKGFTPKVFFKRRPDAKI